MFNELKKKGRLIEKFAKMLISHLFSTVSILTERGHMAEYAFDGLDSV